MLISNRAIPRVAVAGLVLGGCSDDPTPASLAHDACATMIECDFYFDYASVAECENVLEDEFAAEVAGYSGACRDALLDYYSCYLSVVRDTCDPVVPEGACEDEYYRAVDLCS